MVFKHCENKLTNTANHSQTLRIQEYKKKNKGFRGFQAYEIENYGIIPKKGMTLTGCCKYLHTQH